VPLGIRLGAGRDVHGASMELDRLQDKTDGCINVTAEYDTVDSP
jgi:hypothetical protein